ncbi:hypothetical protein [Ornithinimicrobium kibberense]|uniref:hypothetical protein n=1 Tax=Ornithinimicrobium kibberense TaxID=282060 RepID=UPI003621AE11
MVVPGCSRWASKPTQRRRPHAGALVAPGTWRRCPTGERPVQGGAPTGTSSPTSSGSCGTAKAPLMSCERLANWLAPSPMPLAILAKSPRQLSTAEARGGGSWSSTASRCTPIAAQSTQTATRPGLPACSYRSTSAQWLSRESRKPAAPTGDQPPFSSSQRRKGCPRRTTRSSDARPGGSTGRFVFAPWLR